MLKNAVLVAKIGVDTAENEPRKGFKKTYALKDPVGDIAGKTTGFKTWAANAGCTAGWKPAQQSTGLADISVQSWGLARKCMELWKDCAITLYYPLSELEPGTMRISRMQSSHDSSVYPSKEDLCFENSHFLDRLKTHIVIAHQVVQVLVQAS